MTRESVEREKADREGGELAVGESGVDASIEVEYTKPIPRPDSHSQPFFDGTLRGAGGGFSGSRLAGNPHRGQSQYSGITASAAKLGSVSWPWTQ